MARYDPLPIWRDASQRLIVIEDAVRCFSRYHSRHRPVVSGHDRLSSGFKRRVLRLTWRPDFTPTINK